MANPTTNYGFVMPTNTDLVKDLPADFDVFGQAVDTTLKNLNPSTTLGDIEYRSSTANTNTRLAIGSAGQVLTVSSGVPAWTTISSGGITLISETVASANTGIDLTSIPGTYKQLLLIWSGIQHSGSGSYFGLRINNDSGSNYAVQESAVATAATYANVGDSNQIKSEVFGRGASDTGLANYASGQIIFDNYASTTKLKNWYGNFAYNRSGNAFYSWNTRGIYNSTSAITQLNIYRASGTDTISNATNTSIRLYGIS